MKLTKQITIELISKYLSPRYKSGSMGTKQEITALLDYLKNKLQ